MSDPGPAENGRSERARALADIVLALLVFLGAGLAASLAVPALGERTPGLVLLAVQGVLVLAGVKAILALRGERWRDVGLVWIAPRDALRALAVLFATMAANVLLVSVLFAVMPDTVRAHYEALRDVGAVIAGGASLPLLGAGLAFVGLYEEILARGLLLTRCRRLLGGAWAPVIASSVLFGLGHLYQGWLGVAQTALVGAVFAAFTLRWGTLWPAIIAHAALDALSLGIMSGLE